MSEDSEKPKPLEKEKITDAVSAKSRREADSDMEQFVDEQQKLQAVHKAKGLSDAPRDISNTFKRVGIVEIGADGKEIVHVAESKTSSGFQTEIPQETDSQSAGVSSEFRNQPELGFEKSTRSDGGVLLKGIIPGEASLEVSPERHQAAIRATEFLKHEIERLHGTPKLDALGINNDDLGYALGAYLLTPELSNKLGQPETRRLGQNMLVFGIAPAFGMVDEAKEQVTKNFWETVNKGSGDFLIGSGFGALTELHPVVAGVTGIVTGAAFLGDQLFNPVNQARNIEVLEILSRTGNSDIDQLLKDCDQSKDLLGKEAYNASLSAITGGIGFVPGRSVGHGIKYEIAHFDWKLATEYVTEHLRKMPAKIVALLATTTGATHHWRPAAITANESPAVFASPGPSVEKPFGLKMSVFKEERAYNAQSKAPDSLPTKTNTKIESLTRDFQSVSADKASERVRMLQKLSGLSDFEERLIIIGFLVREKQLHPDSPVDLDLIVRPIDLGHLEEYQKAIQNLSLLDENNLSDFPARKIPRLRQDLLEALEKFSMATETMQGLEDAHDKIRSFNKGLDMIIDKGDIIFKPGIYEFTIEQIELQFATTPHRKRLFEGFKELVKDLKEAGCKRIFLDGSFITRKHDPPPGDFDACWEPFKVTNSPGDTLLLSTSYDAVKARKEKYLGDIFPRYSNEYGDRVEQWQFDQRTEKRKGIIVIDL